MRFRYSAVRAWIAGSFVFPIHATLIFIGFGHPGASLWDVVSKSSTTRDTGAHRGSQAFPEARSTLALKRIASKPPGGKKNSTALDSKRTRQAFFLRGFLTVAEAVLARVG